MPSWNQIQTEIESSNPPGYDTVRNKYLSELATKTNRNVIAYYSNFLKRPGSASTSINDDDKNAFMSVIHGLDKSKGLDLILHTPGGDIAATESLVDYLHTIFDNDIRAIIPQISMSAGTMISCSCKSIIMGKQSSLGPIDPQYNGIPTHGVVEEFETAVQEIQDNPKSTPLWQVVIGKYHPTFIGECKKIMEWSEEIVENWLTACMFKDDADSKEKAKKVVKELSDHNEMKAHNRHISMEKCKEIGLKIDVLEEQENDLQDTVLSIHHSFMYAFSSFPEIVKIIENQNNSRMITNEQM